MAEEMNTTTPAASADNAAAGATQTTPEEATAPTTEQKTAFRSFLDKLFGGETEETTPSTKETAPAAAAKQEPEGKTYSEADLQAQVEAAKAALVAEQEEAARLAGLSPEDRAKAEADAKDKKVAELEAQLLQRDLKATALTQLEKDGYPVGLAELLNYSDQASMEKSLGRTQEIFKAALESAVKDKLRGKTPEGLGGAATSENAINDQIAKNIRGGLN